MTPEGTWKAGAAATNITPREPMWLAGWAARREPATRTAQELHAKAIVFEDPDGARAAIVTADLIALPRTLTDAVAARCGLPRERMLFNASHTHTAPEVRPDKVPFFEIPAEFAAKISPYVQWLEEQLVAAVADAAARLVPVTLRVHTTRAAFGHNRRAAGGPADSEVPVLVAARSDGAPLAIVFGYACHNLTLPPAFCAYHGDYAGVAQAALERKFPAATALFLAGAGADQDPAPRGTLELAEAHGAGLADAVAGALGEPGRVVGGPLGVAFEDVVLDLQPLPGVAALEADLRSDDGPRRRKADYLLGALREQRPLPATQACPVQALRFGGELLLVALGGEPVIDFALQFKRELAGPQVWVAGYSNDMFGYLPTRRVQQEGGYEGGRAALWSALPMPLAETAEERIVAAVRRLTRATGVTA